MKLAHGQTVKVEDGWYTRDWLDLDDLVISFAGCDDFMDGVGDEICADLFGYGSGGGDSAAERDAKTHLAAQDYLDPDRKYAPRIRHIYARILSTLPDDDEYAWMIHSTSGPGRGVMKLTEVY